MKGDQTIKFSETSSSGGIGIGATQCDCQFAPYSEAYTLWPRSETSHDGAVFMANINIEAKNLPDGQTHVTGY